MSVVADASARRHGKSTQTKANRQFDSTLLASEPGALNCSQTFGRQTQDQAKPQQTHVYTVTLHRLLSFKRAVRLWANFNCFLSLLLSLSSVLLLVLSKSNFRPPDLRLSVSFLFSPLPLIITYKPNTFFSFSSLSQFNASLFHVKCSSYSRQLSTRDFESAERWQKQHSITEVRFILMESIIFDTLQLEQSHF